jgi:hypothetical protein
LDGVEDDTRTLDEGLNVFRPIVMHSFLSFLPRPRIAHILEELVAGKKSGPGRLPGMSKDTKPRVTNCIKAQVATSKKFQESIDVCADFSGGEVTGVS